MPKVSVIIPSYNHAGYVAGAIRSALDQALGDIEVIVVDDASTDGSQQVIASIRDPRLRYVCQAINRGMSAAINVGLCLANAPYIAVMGSDDVLLPEKLARQAAVLDESSEVAVVFSHVEAMDENGQFYPDRLATPAAIFEVENRGRHQWLAHLFQHGNCFCHPSSLMRRSCLDAVGPYDERLAQLQDFDLWLRVLKRHEVFVLQTPLVRYRWLRSGANLSAPETSRMSRIQWEMTHVLEGYLEFGWEDLMDIFGAAAVAPYRDGGFPPQMVVIDSALTSQRPDYQLFGLNALHGLLPPYGDNTPMHRFLLAKARETDPMRLQALAHIQRQLAELRSR